jgi:hypothetical protein
MIIKVNLTLEDVFSPVVAFLSRCQRIVKADVSSEIRCVARTHKNGVEKVYRIYALSHHNFCDTGNVDFSEVA